MIPGEELLFVALGGSGEIGMNVNLYGCDGTIAGRSHCSARQDLD